MNTTTFTIESVHGVKQTFVLGLPAQETAEDQRRTQQELDPNVVARDVVSQDPVEASRAPR